MVKTSIEGKTVLASGVGGGWLNVEEEVNPFSLRVRASGGEERPMHSGCYRDAIGTGWGLSCHVHFGPLYCEQFDSGMILEHNESTQVLALSPTARLKGGLPAYGSTSLPLQRSSES